MHIPDGFIAPKLYLPAYLIAAGLWFTGLRRLRRRLTEETIPLLSVTTALAFILMMLLIPLPGGTSAHATGMAVLAILFGVWISFLAISMVLLLQALLFGAGGVTTLPVNALAIGFVGSVVAVSVFRTLRRFHETAALFLAGWLALNVAAALIGIALGIQPVLARREDGTPLFFPFGIGIALPAVVVPHLVIGVGEGILTVLVYRLFSKRRGTGREGDAEGKR
jgi:cobalt/nickel transport system permease protein